MAPKSSNLAILFADISGSTKLFEQLGDSVAQTTIANCLELLGKIANKHNGNVIKTIGDEIMCTFKSIDDAVRASCEMHQTLEYGESSQSAGMNSNTLIADLSQTEANPAPPDINYTELMHQKQDPVNNIKIRVGMHYGPAILESGDVYGDAVNVAARMTAQAKASQTLTTQATRAGMDRLLRISTRFVDRAHIKGKKDEINIFEVLWEGDELTSAITVSPSLSTTAPPVDKSKEPDIKLFLNYQGKKIVLDKQQSSIILGRSNRCDITVNEKLASRQHVLIELRRDKFFIKDQSTNGTYVHVQDKNESFLKREEMQLIGNGKLSLGRAFKENPKEIITFNLKQSTI